MRKMLFIMNPTSGQKRANKVLADILEVFSRADYDVIFRMTGAPGDATAIVRRLGPEVDLVVCCGGDGTFNETVRGLIDARVDIPIGYIPSGSTNDFASSLKLSADPVQAARNIVSGEVRAYDAGSFNGRFFSYVASFGLFTKTSYTTPQEIKNILGHMAYVLEGISELSQVRTEHVVFQIGDERIEDDFLFGAVCNSTSVGGVLTLDPAQVSMTDGKLEVLLVRAPKNVYELAECIQAVQTQHYNDCAMISFRSASSMQITADPSMDWTLDGERQEGCADIRVEDLHLVYKLISEKQA